MQKSLKFSYEQLWEAYSSVLLEDARHCTDFDDLKGSILTDLLLSPFEHLAQGRHTIHVDEDSVTLATDNPRELLLLLTLSSHWLDVDDDHPLITMYGNPYKVLHLSSDEDSGFVDMLLFPLLKLIPLV